MNLKLLSPAGGALKTVEEWVYSPMTLQKYARALPPVILMMSASE